MIAYRDFVQRTIKLLFFVILFTYNSIAAGKGLFSYYEHPEELLELKPKKKPSSLYINHEIPGSIHLQGWHQDHIAVSVHKRAYNKEDAERMSTTLTQTEHGIITLETTEAEALHKHAKVDITVHIPHHIATTISTLNEVTLAQTDNAIRVETEKGEITTQNTRGTLHLNTKKGDITVIECHGALNIATERGSITVEDSYNNIIAETAHGPITVDCARVPSTACIELRTQKRGSIKLSIPESTNARLIADTTRGTVTSDVLITLERHTMVLNSDTYKDFQRHIRGMLGQQATAEIKLNSTKDIHITSNDADAEHD